MQVILVILFVVLSSISYGKSPYPITITEEDKQVAALIERARYWSDILVMKSPKYVWGGEGLNGGDCSGQVHWILKKSGASFPRTTALKIWSGAWPGYNYNNWENTTFPDGIFFSWKKTADHMGLVDYKLDYPNELHYMEASSGAGKFKKTTFKKDSIYNKRFLGIRVFDFTVGLGTVKPDPINKDGLW